LSRHQIDTSTVYDPVLKLTETRSLEDSEIDPAPGITPTHQIINREPYLPSPGLVEAVNLAIALGRPLLLQGDPGCGKTRLAYAVRYALGLPLETCYIKSTTQAKDLLYTYDAVNRLYDAQLGADGPKDKHGEPLCKNVDNYIHLGPLGRAIVRAQYGRRSVVLIDEIDKADLDFPNDLLLELDRLEFRIDESINLHHAVPPNRPELRPIVFVTHNEEKALPDAFLRRCIFHFIEFPEDRDYVKKLLSLHQIEDETLKDKAIEVLFKLRRLDLTKKPGLSELLDWVGYLQAVKTPMAQLTDIPFIGVLLKQREDQMRMYLERTGL
jgi:MoxR-like ATPase